MKNGGVPTMKGGTYYGDVKVGPFVAEIKFEHGVWQFLPRYTNNPKSMDAIHMNAMIRDQGRIWTAVPECDIETLKGVLGVE
jgi:hypothetical protein